MRIATHPEAIKHLVKIGMASDISEHIKMVESANESLIKEKDELRSVAEDNKRECEATRIENARLKAEVERLTQIIDSFKTMPIIEGQSFNGWKLDEHHRLVSLVEYLRAGSIEGAKQFTHKEYRDFQKTMIEKNAAKEGKTK
jgi:hypothetical protein